MLPNPAILQNFTCMLKLLFCAQAGSKKVGLEDLFCNYVGSEAIQLVANASTRYHFIPKNYYNNKSKNSTQSASHFQTYHTKI